MSATLPLVPPIAQLYSFSYSMAAIFLLLGSMELVVYNGKLSADQARNLIAVAAAGWTLAAPWLFVDWYWAVSAPLLFIFLNIAVLRWDFLKTLNPGPGRLGALLFTVSLVAVVLVAWPLSEPGRELRPLVALAMMPAGFTDACAAFFGRLYGRERLPFKRSWVGSLAGLGGALVAYLLTLWVFGLWRPLQLLLALGGAVVVTAVELFSPPKLDNLTTALAAGACGYLILTVGAV